MEEAKGLPRSMHLIHRTPLSRPRKFLGLDDDDDVFVGMKGVVWLRGVCWRGLSRSARGRHRQSPAAEFLGIRGWLVRLERDGARDGRCISRRSAVPVF